MRALRFNHVSISAPDMEASLEFYVGVLGLERIASPDFPDVEVEWLRLGNQQLHLFARAVDAPLYHHIGIDVDDFEAAYLKGRELGLLDPDAFGGTSVRRFLDGAVQMYLRDPAGNLVEVNWPDESTLDPEVVDGIVRIEDQCPQAGAALQASLYPPSARRGAAGSDLA
jgi:catechol 2,3-dioxygenase-like lactoylglutathione lyase family enzyme